MIPFWKFVRECKRIVTQLRLLPGIVWEYFFATFYYDRFLAARRKTFDGGLVISNRIAIYLIFPEKSLLASHFAALEFMSKNGYAPLVVSNVVLSEEQRHQLLPHCWRYIERVNFGYDFGGYRDGILSISDMLPQLSHLALFNDSTWFPLPKSANWLADAEKLGVDFAGAASNYGAGRVDVDQYKEIVWNYSSQHKNFHYCSFALLFSRTILIDREFAAFWHRFRISQSKKRTVRRGEIGLTQWVLRKGYSHGVTCDISDLDRQLMQVNDDRLRIILNRIMIPEDPRILALKRQIQELDYNQSNWADMVRQFILTAVVRQGSSYALADFTIQEKNFTFLKKSPVWLNDDASQITVEIAKCLTGPFGQQVLLEVLALRSRLKPAK
jgi:hypothetical protein